MMPAKRLSKLLKDAFAKQSKLRSSVRNFKPFISSFIIRTGAGVVGAAAATSAASASSVENKIKQDESSQNGELSQESTDDFITSYHKCHDAEWIKLLESTPTPDPTLDRLDRAWTSYYNELTKSVSSICAKKVYAKYYGKYYGRDFAREKSDNMYNCVHNHIMHEMRFSKFTNERVYGHIEGADALIKCLLIT